MKNYERSDLYFDKAEVQKALTFIENVRHSKGQWAGKRFRLEPWQVFLIANIFGFYYKGTRRRKYNNAFLSVARKNGKSTLAAAIALKYLLLEGEYSGEVYSVATKRDQAKIIFEESKKMVKLSPELSARITVYRDSLLHEPTFSVYRPLGADYDRLDGLGTSCGLIDELHAHKTRQLFEVIQTSSASRVNPLIMITTTASAEIEKSIYSDLKRYSLAVLDDQSEIEDDSWFSMIYQLDEEDNKEDTSKWIKANPNLGVSLTQEYLESQQNKLSLSGSIASFERYHLNLDVAGEASYIPYEVWVDGQMNWYMTESGVKIDTPFNLLKQRGGQKAYCGIDLSSVEDLTAVVFSFNTEQGIEIIPLIWVPQYTARRLSLMGDLNFPIIAKNELVYVTAGRTIDYDEIRSTLKRLRDEYGIKIEEIAMDPHNARYLITRMVDEDGFTVFEHRQGFISMSDPVKTMRKLVLERRLLHGNHPLLNWCMGNARTLEDAAGNLKLEKRTNEKKIDPVVAAVMSVYRAYTQTLKKETKPRLLIL